MSKKRDNDFNTLPETVGLGDYYAQAADAIRRGDDETALEAMRQLDEPQPRKILPYLELLIAEHDRLTPIIDAGKGMSERAETLDMARRFLRQTQPTDGAHAEQLAADLIRLDRECLAAKNAVDTAGHATNQQNVIEVFCPLLFGLDPACQHIPRGYSPTPAISNWQIENHVELVYRDGWVFTKLVAPPSTPRRKLIAR